MWWKGTGPPYYYKLQFCRKYLPWCWSEYLDYLIFRRVVVHSSKALPFSAANGTVTVFGKE